MNLDFKDSKLETDYYSSPDCLNSIPWCYIETGTWHILLPFGCSTSQRQIQAYPVRDRQEPDHWRWRLALGYTHLALYHRCILPYRPGYPGRSSRIERTAVLYTYSSASLFSATPTVHNRSCTLWLMRA